ncbi:hypothetical protein Ddc_14382 [Ditylenchus destructor]|nr:hypothetical protein Ddc_14382 [Ditylenchus destructor]
MLPYWCLLDILKYLDRNYLERIQVTNRLLNDIVNREFVTHPLRVIPGTMWVAIKNNELIIMCRTRCCLVPREWDLDREWNRDHCFGGCKHFYPINVMRPFLCKNVRFKHTMIVINGKNSFSKYKTDHITSLEAISHIWAWKDLYIRDNSDNDPSSQKLILSSSSVFQCRALHVQDNKRRIEILQNPDIYSLNALDLHGTISDSEMLQIVQQFVKQKASYPHSDTTLVFYGSTESIAAVVKMLKQEFLTSEDRCRLRLIMKIMSLKDFSDFRLENSRTNEVLELKGISHKQANDEFNVDITYGPALLLDRYIV